MYKRDHQGAARHYRYSHFLTAEAEITFNRKNANDRGRMARGMPIARLLDKLCTFASRKRAFSHAGTD